jgi:ketosteroid isomerase-like protein
MLDTQQARNLANAYVAAMKREDAEGVLALCAEEVEYAGIFVRKLTGEPSGTIRGKATLRRFLRDIFREMGSSGYALNRLAVGIDSAVLEVAVAGIIPIFVLLVADEQGKITQVKVHQVMP